MSTFPCDLNHIPVFRAVVRSGSFSKAAELLGEQKSKVSRVIAALEHDVGVQLIYRTTRSLTLTEAGQEFYRRIDGMLDSLAEAIGDVGRHGDEVSGLLSVSAPDHLGLALLVDVCREFMAIYPAITIDLRLENSFEERHHEAIIDVALTIGKLKDSAMVRRVIGHGKATLVISAELMGQLEPLTDLEQLGAIPAVCFTHAQVQHGITLGKGDESRTVRPQAKMIVNSFLAVKSLVLSGCGWALLPNYLISDELRRRQLIALFSDWHFPGPSLQFVTPSHREPIPKVERFLDFAVRRLSTQF